MATTVTHIVDPNSGAGFDYDSLYDWEAGEQGDLTGVRDEIAVAKCQCTGGTADTTAIVIDGWTLSATQYIKVWTDPAESYRHNGTYQTGNKYRLEIDSVTALTIADSHVRIYGISVGLPDTANPRVAIGLAAGASGVIHVAYSILTSFYTGAAAVRRGINTNGSSTGTISIWNSLFYDFNASGDGTSAGVNTDESGYTFNIYNCTFCDSERGIKRAASTVTAINCLASGTENGFQGTITTSYCAVDAVDDATLTGTGDRNDQTFTFVNAGANDFHLDSTDSGARDYGDGSTVKSVFTDDIGGQARPATDLDWDIGAFEYVAAVSALSISVSEALSFAEALD